MITALSLYEIHVNGDALYVAEMARQLITSAQARMARAALRLGVREIADRAGVSPATIVRVEREQGAANTATLAVLRAAYEAAGVQFPDSDTVRFSAVDCDTGGNAGD